MRQIGTLSEEALARRLSDYLLTREIDTRVMPDAGGWAVWVCDEDKVDSARQELARFEADPHAGPYLEAARVAQRLRQREERQEEEYKQRQRQLNERMARGSRGSQPVTFMLIVISVGVALASGMGEKMFSPVLQALFIAPFQQRGEGIAWFHLSSILRGEVWRLVTPIFIHFGPIHLLFNMLMLHDLGGMVERRRGPWRYLGLVLVAAVLSNLAEYYVALSFQTPTLVALDPSPTFGGMSGVLYAVFGYAWMKTRFEPELGVFLNPGTVIILLGWLILCMTGGMGRVANTAHLVGLLVGVAVGYAPVLWHSLRGR